MVTLLHSYREGFHITYGAYALLGRAARWQAENLFILQTSMICLTVHLPLHLPSTQSPLLTSLSLSSSVYTLHTGIVQSAFTDI